LLRQDLKAALKVLGQDEIDDAQSLLKEQGFHSSDFEIIQRADPSPSYPSHVTGTVTVLRKSNQIAKRYEAGSGSTWLEQLEIDLKAGAYGRHEKTQTSTSGHSRISMTLAEFGDLLSALPVGQTGTLPYSVYAVFFPPGEPDQGARMRAFDFARAHGCEIENRPSAQQVVFIKKITNPTPRNP
jgi:hypothetical protein